MAFLLVVSGPNEGDYHPLESRSITIGRHEECPIQIADDLVSRQHMRIRHDEGDGAYVAVDKDSANGVFVNGKRITETPLANGDIIQIGDSEIIYSEQDFIDRDTALEHYRRRPEHDDTIIR